MQRDCLEHASRTLAAQKEKAKFKPARYLYPTEKAAAPFRIWCIDTIVGLKPAAPDGATDVLVAVDPFTKWVEAGAVPTLNSHETAFWFHREITCRYGIPAVVRSDKGLEFQGEFANYLKRYGVLQRTIATMNPRANG